MPTCTTLQVKTTRFSIDSLFIEAGWLSAGLEFFRPIMTSTCLIWLGHDPKKDWYWWRIKLGCSPNWRRDMFHTIFLPFEGFFFFLRNFEAEVIHVILANLLESSQWECLWYGKTIHLGRIHKVIESSDGNWLKPLWKYLWQNRGANLTANSPSNPYSDALHSSTSLPSFFIFYFFTRVLIKVLGYVKGKTFHVMAHLNFKQ